MMGNKTGAVNSFLTHRQKVRNPGVHAMLCEIARHIASHTGAHIEVHCDEFAEFPAAYYYIAVVSCGRCDEIEGIAVGIIPKLNKLLSVAVGSNVCVFGIEDKDVEYSAVSEAVRRYARKIECSTLVCVREATLFSALYSGISANDVIARETL